jgi:hypothetical protein
VPGLKGPHSTCQHQTAKGCGIYRDPKRPAVCAGFKCAWLHGLGHEEHRPDKCGAMFTLNMTTDGKKIGYCIETEPDAIKTTAERMAVLFVRRLAAPIIVVKAGVKPPDDRGDYVVVRTDQELKAIMMLGKHVRAMAPDVNLFDLVRSNG